MRRWLVLDLDGTLVNSLPDLAAALNRLVTPRGIAAYSEAEVQPMIGDGAQVLMERAFAARGLALSQADIEALVADYTDNAADLTRPYPGVTDTLGQLREAGWTMAVCTNKPVAAARVVLHALRLDGFFATVGGGDSYPVRKPDPAHLLGTLSACGGDPARAVMVGDHHNDILAASGAGVASVFARWGYGRDVPHASAEAERFADLPEILDRLVAA